MIMKGIVKFFLVTFIFTMGYIKCEAQQVFLDVRIYSTVNIQELHLKVFSGKYELRTNEEKTTDLYKNSTISLKATDSIVQVFQNNQLLTSAPMISIKGVGFLNTFEIEPTKPSFAKRIYDDNLVVKAIGNNLVILNNIELEHYIAGVVESEGGGSSKDIDFFLVQAISCRTYALANIRKHWSEGYHLCDDVHCQAYKGRCKISLIMMATSQTSGKVLVDQNGKMISAAFHSNSGGQTMNSEDVWSSATSYLKSVVDTFSLVGRNAKWEKKMTTTEWLNFLKTKYNYPIDDPEMREKALNFKQPNRLVNFPGNIPLKDIRRDLKLKSAFFSVVNMGDEILLDGRGFGHGVGMSQEGAIRMIQLGYSYEDVIHFYYKDVKIVSFDKLDYFFINYNY
jgi:stage II sporulation protein D